MTGKLGILAGGGDLPARLVEACRLGGRDIFILAFEGHTDPALLQGVEHTWIRLGASNGALRVLREANVTDLVMAGNVTRPRLAELRPDLRMIRFFAGIGAQSLGDGGLLKAVVKELEAEGFRILGADDIMADLLATPGPYGVEAPDSQALSDIASGVVVARALGAADVGQAVVVQQGIVLGVEAAEGTDGLLARCGVLSRAGPGGVLVKMKKPGQETRVDLPAIGVRTVRNAAAAGLRGIAVEAGAALVIDRAAVAAAADEAGLFVVGIPSGQ